MSKKYPLKYNPGNDGRRALALLCTRNDAEYDRVCAKAIRWDRHPFGFTPLVSCGSGERDYLRLAYPDGHTDESVECMLVVLRHILQLVTVGRLPSLRIIRVVNESIPVIGEPGYGRETHKHDLFFELAFDRRVYIVGGCNDFSGEGGDGGNALQSVFGLVSRTLQIPISDVSLFLSACKCWAT